LANPGYSVLAALKSSGERFDIVYGHNLPSAPAVKLAKARVKIVTLHGFIRGRSGYYMAAYWAPWRSYSRDGF